MNYRLFYKVLMTEIKATPAIFINGRQLSDRYSANEFKTFDMIKTKSLMRIHTKLILITLLIQILAFKLDYIFAQSINEKGIMSMRAPSNVKIDGKIQEWGNFKKL